MTIKAILAALIAASILSGCAQKSDKITASYMPATTYQGLSCEQMRAEAVTLNTKAKLLGATQDAKASGDAAKTAVAVVLFWPALFLISGDGANAAELAEVKGRADALRTAAAASNCNF